MSQSNAQVALGREGVQDPARFASALVQHRITRLTSTPTLLAHLLPSLTALGGDLLSWWHPHITCPFAIRLLTCPRCARPSFAGSPQCCSTGGP